MRNPPLELAYQYASAVDQPLEPSEADSARPPRQRKPRLKVGKRSPSAYMSDGNDIPTKLPLIGRRSSRRRASPRPILGSAVTRPAALTLYDVTKEDARA